MNEVKWIKLSIEMFDNRKIRHIRKLPEGNNIVLIWVMLLTLAGKCNAGGMIFLTENIPYTTKMLADELDFEESTIILALEALKSLGMISMDGFLSIVGWEEHQNAEALATIREHNRLAKQKYRERQKQKQLASGCDSDTSNDASDTSNDGHVQDMSTDNVEDISADSSYSISSSIESKSLLKEKEIGVQGEEGKQEPAPKPQKEKKKKPADLFETFAGEDTELLEALREYEKNRHERKKPLSDRSKTMLINKLRDKYPPEQWVAIVDQSTLRGWDSFYPLKDDEDWTSNRNRKQAKSKLTFLEMLKEDGIEQNGNYDDHERTSGGVSGFLQGFQ